MGALMASFGSEDKAKQWRERKEKLWNFNCNTVAYKGTMLFIATRGQEASQEGQYQRLNNEHRRLLYQLHFVAGEWRKLLACTPYSSTRCLRTLKTTKPSGIFDLRKTDNEHRRP